MTKVVVVGATSRHPSVSISTMTTQRSSIAKASVSVPLKARIQQQSLSTSSNSKHSSSTTNNSSRCKAVPIVN